MKFALKKGECREPESRISQLVNGEMRLLIEKRHEVDLLHRRWYQSKKPKLSGRVKTKRRKGAGEIEGIRIMGIEAIFFPTHYLFLLFVWSLPEVYEFSDWSPVYVRDRPRGGYWTINLISPLVVELRDVPVWLSAHPSFWIYISFKFIFILIF